MWSATGPRGAPAEAFIAFCMERARRGGATAMSAAP
jgi:hypothetical protein